MNATYLRRTLVGMFCAAVAAETLPTFATAQVGSGVVRAGSYSNRPPVVTNDRGAVRGVTVTGGYAFRGLPYAAAPVGNLRWRPPQHPASWRGVRDATRYAPSCLQKPSLFQPPGPESEDCLYLNTVPSGAHDGPHPVPDAPFVCRWA